MYAFKYLLIKEFKQYKANPFLVRLTLIYPLFVMLIIPWMATLDVREVNIAVVNQDHSSTAEKLVKQIEASDFFNITSVCMDYGDAIIGIKNGSCDLIIHIPSGLENSIINKVDAEVYIAANAVNSIKGGVACGYLSGIISDFSKSFYVENSNGENAFLNISAKNLYNPDSNYRYFMAPALLVIVLLLFCGFLPTLNIVMEKERGTIEQINITPVRKIVFIGSKLLFYGILGLLVFSIAFILGKIVYNIDPYGNLNVIYVAAILFLLFISAFGLFISNYSNTLQQAVFTMFFFWMIFMLLSGIFTPISSMQKWAQYLTYLFPTRYFVDILRSVCIKGCGYLDLVFEFIMLAIAAISMIILAVITYKKRK